MFKKLGRLCIPFAAVLTDMIKNIIAVLLISTLSPSLARSAELDPMPPAGLRHLFFEFGGFFLLDFQKSKKLIGQDHSGDQIVINDDQKGYRVLQNVKAGIGVERIFHYDIPSHISLGIDFMVGKNVSFDRFAPSREAAKQLPAPSVPLLAEELDQWTIGDNVIYQASGGIGFAPGVGWIPVAGAAPYLFAEGDWFLYIEKTGENQVYVKVTNTHIFAFGAVAKSIVTGLSLDLFREIDKGFSFSYDLRDAAARDAYEDAVRGSLEPSQNLSSVTQVHETQAAAVGFMRSWYFGAPFLSSVGGRAGQIHSFSNQFNHFDGSRSEVHSGIYVNHSHSRGWLSNQTTYVNDFFGNYYLNTASDNTQSRGYLGQYFWAYESSKVSDKKIRKQLEKLVAKTGLTSLLSLEIPQEDKFGYLNIKFNAELTQRAIDTLMAWATTPELFGLRLSDVSRSDIQSYFASGSDPLKICAPELSNPDDCKNQMLVDTDEANRKMIEELAEMVKAKDADPKRFARHFGHFGKQMATNQFTFQQILTIVGRASVPMVLSMEGERISVFKKVVDATSDGPRENSGRPEIIVP